MKEKPMTEDQLRKWASNHRIYIKQDSTAGEAWAEWCRKHGKSQVWDAKGGWWFPSKFPPGTPGPMLD